MDILSKEALFKIMEVESLEPILLPVGRIFGVLNPPGALFKPHAEAGPVSVASADGRISSYQEPLLPAFAALLKAPTLEGFKAHLVLNALKPDAVLGMLEEEGLFIDMFDTSWFSTHGLFLEVDVLEEPKENGFAKCRVKHTGLDVEVSSFSFSIEELCQDGASLLQAIEIIATDLEVDPNMVASLFLRELVTIVGSLAATIERI